MRLHEISAHPAWKLHRRNRSHDARCQARRRPSRTIKIRNIGRSTAEPHHQDTVPSLSDSKKQSLVTSSSEPQISGLACGLRLAACGSRRPSYECPLLESGAPCPASTSCVCLLRSSPPRDSRQPRICFPASRPAQRLHRQRLTAYRHSTTAQLGQKCALADKQRNKSYTIVNSGYCRTSPPDRTYLAHAIRVCPRPARGRWRSGRHSPHCGGWLGCAGCSAPLSRKTP